VKALTLDARQWQSADDVFEALLAALGAPDWHGRNLDALNDSLRGGDFNAINPPLTIQVTSLEEASAVARLTAWRIRHLFTELAKDGIPLAWSSFVGFADAALSVFEEFRAAALEKARAIETGDASQDAKLHSTMGARLRQLFERGGAGRDFIEALLHDDRPQVAIWIAAELAARGDQRGTNVLQALAQLPGLRGFSARMALSELREGQLRSPFRL
jgi:RNAse (barnase) inhibitor barstar